MGCNRWCTCNCQRNAANAKMHQEWEQENKQRRTQLVTKTFRIWDSLDVATKKAFFEVKIEDLKRHSSTCYPNCTSLIGTGVTDTLDEELNVWCCDECNQSFSKKEDFELHVDQHLVHYFAAKEITLHPINREGRNTILNGRWKPLDPLGSRKSHLDCERASLLKKIKLELELLITNDCVCQIHVDTLKGFVDAAFKDSHAMTKLLQHTDLHFGICCLCVPSLTELLQMLKGLVHGSELNQAFTGSSHAQYYLSEPPKIHLIVDKTKFTVDIEFFTKDNASTEEKGTVEAVDLNKWAEWLFTNYEYVEWTKYWDSWLAKRKAKMVKFHAALASQLEGLRESCQRKFRLLQVLKICEEVPELEPGLADALLRRRNELEGQADAETYESSAITDLLVEADELDAQTKDGTVENFSAISYFKLEDEIVQKAAKTLLEKKTTEIMEVEARLRGGCFAVEKLSVYFRKGAWINYHLLFMPLVQSFLQKQAEDMIDMGFLNDQLENLIASRAFKNSKVDDLIPSGVSDRTANVELGESSNVNGHTQKHSNNKKNKHKG